MKKRILCFILCLASYGAGISQNYDWTKTMGTNSFDLATAMCKDASGNLYVSGNFSGTMDADPGPGITELEANGLFDFFILKFNSNGNLLWAKSCGGTLGDGALAIAADMAGNVYTTGYFTANVDFNPGTGTETLTAMNNTTDIFVLKLDALGNFVWARSFGGASSTESGLSIQLDASANVFVGGYFEGLVDFDPGIDMEFLSSNGSTDVFVQKLDSDGNFVWVRTFGGPSADEFNNLTVDASGSVYSIGYFEGTVDFNPGAGSENLIASGNSDVFIQKLDAAGNFVWAKSFGGPGYDRATSIQISEAGNLYTAGYFEGTVDFDPGAGNASLTSKGDADVFVQKLDTLGNYVWAKSFGGLGGDSPSGLYADAGDQVYLSGSFIGTVDFDPGSGTKNLIAGNGGDAFVLKLDALGNYDWAVSFNGGGNTIMINAITIHSNFIYTAGQFDGTPDFDPGAGVSNQTSEGSADVFIHRMSQQNTSIGKHLSYSALSVYPNPSQETFYLSLYSPLYQAFMRVIDVQGKTILEKPLDDLLLQSFKFDGPSGVYFLEVTSSEGQHIVRIVKE